MSQHLIDIRSKRDIDILADKVLQGLGYPEPPLNLEDVRALQDLNKEYYSSTDPSIFKEFVSKMTIAGKQIWGRPLLLFEAIRNLDLKALFILDGKRILLDETQPQPKHRWNEIHEIGHTIIPWHADLMYGDTEQSLSPAYREIIEAEANYSGGRLLFLGERFTSESRDVTMSISAVKKLAKRYGNTITSTLWRHVEAATIPAIAVVSGHPAYACGPFARAEEMCKHSIYSPDYVQRFGAHDGNLLMPAIASYCSRKTRGPLGMGEIVITDLNGARHIFTFETFHNTHQALSLGTYLRRDGKIYAVSA